MKKALVFSVIFLLLSSMFFSIVPVRAQDHNDCWDQDVISMLNYIKQCYIVSTHTFNWQYPTGDQAKYDLFFKVAKDVDNIRDQNKDVSILNLGTAVDVAEKSKDIIDVLNLQYSVNIEKMFGVLSYLEITDEGEVSAMVSTFESKLVDVSAQIGQHKAEFTSATDVENFIEARSYDHTIASANWAQASTKMEVESGQGTSALSIIFSIWDCVNAFYKHKIVIAGQIAALQETTSDQTDQNVLSKTKEYEGKVEFGIFVTDLAKAVGKAVGTAAGQGWGLEVGTAVGTGFIATFPPAPLVGAAIGYLAGGVIVGAAVEAAAGKAAEIITSQPQVFGKPLLKILDDLGISTVAAKITAIYSDGDDRDVIAKEKIWITIQNNEPSGTSAKEFVVSVNPSYWTVTDYWGTLDPIGDYLDWDNVKSITLDPGAQGTVWFAADPDQDHLDETLTFVLWYKEGMLWWTKETMLTQQKETFCSAPPKPVIASVDYAHNVMFGSAINIDVYVRNDGFPAAWQTIAISFPVNQPLPTKISIVQSDLNSYGIHIKGESISAAYSTKTVTLQTYLIEGASPWPFFGDTHYLKISVTPSTAGIFTFYVKSVAAHALSDVACRWTPDKSTSTTLDQQEEYCYKYTIAVGGGSETVVYSEGFENSDGGYAHAGTLDQWQWGSPSYFKGPSSAHSGLKCWGTNLQGDVPKSSDSYLTSPPITLNAINLDYQTLRVEFYAWIAVDEMYDRGEFQVSSDGVSYATIAELFHIMQGTWSAYDFDISNFAGGNIYLRFVLHADGADAFTQSSYNMAGLYVDDIKITIYEKPVQETSLTLKANEDQSAYASCPWISPWNGYNYVLDNDVYPTARGANNEYTDYYKLNVPLSQSNGKYSIKLQEVTQETSFTDYVQLLAVDHSAASKIASDDKGNIWAYSNPFPPFRALDGNGNDVTAQLSTIDNSTIKCYDGNTITLDFSNVNTTNGATLIIQATGFLSDGTADSPTNHPASIQIRTQDSSQQWITRGTFYPRNNAATGAYNLAPYLNYSKVVRIYVTSCNTEKYHAIDYVALDNQPQVLNVTSLSPTSATHSVTGDVCQTLLTSDGSYVSMGEGENILLSFDAPPNTDQVRDFVFVAKGYYVPSGTYFIYTWDGAAWVERDAWSVNGNGNQEHTFDMSLFLPDPNGQYKVRIWQDYWYDPAGIDYVALSHGSASATLASAFDQRKKTDVSSLLSSPDGSADSWGIPDSGYPYSRQRNRFVDVTFTFVGPQNIPPSTKPVSVENCGTNAPIISWTYSDLDGDMQISYQAQVWTAPGGTGSIIWNPQVISGSATSMFYTGPQLDPLLTYYVRVKAFDGQDWGQWSECAFKNVNSGYNLPPNADLGPTIGSSGGRPIVNWWSPTTFTYIDSSAISVDIKIQLDDGGSSINGAMKKWADSLWTYSIVFYPRSGAAYITYTAHYSSNSVSTTNFYIYVDPAGYVYDVNTNQRIAGATVWLQRLNSSGGWENVPTGANPANMQPDTNPLITNANGQYQWDVLGGTYRVHVEAARYYPADSIVVTVPPPVTDLHVGLTPLPTSDPTSLNYTGATSGQYSDPAALSATLKDLATNSPISGKTVSFTIGTQTTTGTTNASGVATASITLTQPSGAYTVTASFAGDSNYKSSSNSKPFTVDKENVAITYTGDTLVFTAGPTISTAPVHLAAHLVQESDGYPGDLTVASVTFALFKSSNLGSTPDLTYDASVNSTGDAHYDLASLPADVWTVRVTIKSGNLYWTQTSEGLGILVVSLPGLSATGGGWIPDSGSANGKDNFGFTLQYNNKLVPRGNFIFVFRGKDGYDYVVKSNSWQGGGLSFTDTNKAYFSAKCNVQKIDRTTGAVVASWGNYKFAVDVTDGGLTAPKTADTIAIRILNPANAIWRQIGTTTAQIPLGGGNIVIHSK